jgi:hypothetical protein
MERKSFHDSEKLLRVGIAAARERICARDPELASALDVPPPINPSDDTASQGTGSASGDGRGVAYRAARKIYRALKHLELLWPILEKARNEVRRRF